MVVCSLGTSWTSNGLCDIICVVDRVQRSLCNVTRHRRIDCDEDYGCRSRRQCSGRRRWYIGRYIYSTRTRTCNGILLYWPANWSASRMFSLTWPLTSGSDYWWSVDRTIWMAVNIMVPRHQWDNSVPASTFLPARNDETTTEVARSRTVEWNCSRTNEMGDLQDLCD